MSEHQARIIVAFMAINCGKSTSDIDTTVNLADDEPADRPFSLSNDLCTGTIHELVQRMAIHTKTTKTQGDEQTCSSKSASSAMHIGEQLWGLKKSEWPPGVQAWGLHRKSDRAQLWSGQSADAQLHTEARGASKSAPVYFLLDGQAG